jgi:hypothetical protein
MFYFSHPRSQAALIGEMGLAEAAAAPAPPVWPVARSISLEVSEVGGISRDLARDCVRRANGDLTRAVQLAMEWSALPISLSACRLLLSCLQFLSRVMFIVPFFHFSPFFSFFFFFFPLLCRLDSQSLRGECPICLQAFSGNGVLLSSCPHALCRECITGYIDAALQDGSAAIQCPVAGCRAEYAHADLRSVLSAEAFQRLDARALEQCIARDPTLHFCKTPDCTYVAWWAGPDDGPPCLDCPRCGITRCQGRRRRKKKKKEEPKIGG